MARQPERLAEQQRTLGRYLAALRQAAGLYQADIARAVPCHRTTVTHAEAGSQLPDAYFWEIADRLVGANGVLIVSYDELIQAKATHLAEQQAKHRARAHAAVRQLTAAPSPRVGADTVLVVPVAAEMIGHGVCQPSGPAEVENTNRRELVASVAGIAFGASLEQPLETIIAAADEPQIPTRVRAGDVRHLRNDIEILEEWDHHAGGGAVRHHVIAVLRRATTMLNASCTPVVRRELAAATAYLADLAGWATFDWGHHSAARQLFLLGLHAARESGDLGMRAHVASGLARQEIHIGNWAAGLDLTQLAFTATEALTPNAIAMLHTVKALAYARKLDAAQCRQCLGIAIDAYQPDSIAKDPPWIRYFTPAKLEGDLANAMYELSLGGADVGDRVAYRLDLVERLSTAFRQYSPDRARSKAITATRLATLLYLEGEQRTAHQMADEAISLARRVRSARLADDLRVLLRTTPPGDGDDGPRDLRHRVSAVLTEMI